MLFYMYNSSISHALVFVNVFIVLWYNIPVCIVQTFLEILYLGFIQNVGFKLRAWIRHLIDSIAIDGKTVLFNVFQRHCIHRAAVRP